MAVSTMKLYALEDAMVRSGAPDTVYHNNASISMPYASQREESCYYFRPDLTLGDAIRKHILGYQPYIYVTNKRMTESGWSAYEYYIVARQAFASTLEALTYNNQENIITEEFGTSYGSKTTPYSEVPTGSYWTPCDIIPFDASQNIAKIEERFNHEGLTFQGVAGANKPYLLLSIEDAEIAVNQTPMAGAYVNRHRTVKLAWAIATNAYGGAAAFAQASAIVTWRDGVNGEENAISITGVNTECSIPADTFPATNDLQWKVAIIFASGETAESGWTTVTTLDKASTCTARKPINIYVDGSIENEFRWEHTNSTGTEQTAYDLQYSADSGTTWVNIAQSIASTVEKCNVAANTLPSGMLKWRVRTYNADGIAGEWCSPVEIIVIAAPKAPAIATATETPRPEITWSADEQQGYQVQTIGYDSGIVYGTIKKHKIPNYLPDGITEIRVRVQNEYGMWSEWARVSVTVSNAQIGKIDLTTQTENAEAILKWTGKHTLYYIYRDGILIGKTVGMEFIDHYSIGTHKYTVRGVVGDNYDMSNAAEITLECKIAMIADVETCAWHVLRHKRGAEPIVSVSTTHDVAYQHYAGRRLPMAEIADYEDESYSFEYAFLDRAEAIAIRNALLGHVVVLKTPHGECYIGILESMSHSTDSIATDVQFTMRAVDWKEEITYDV